MRDTWADGAPMVHQAPDHSYGWGLFSFPPPSGIRNRVFFPRTGYWCRDCEYAQHCRAWKGN